MIVKPVISQNKIQSLVTADNSMKAKKKSGVKEKTVSANQ